MTSVSAGHIILTPTQPVGSGGHSGNQTQDLLTTSPGVAHSTAWLPELPRPPPHPQNSMFFLKDSLDKLDVNLDLDLDCSG